MREQHSIIGRSCWKFCVYKKCPGAYFSLINELLWEIHRIRSGVLNKMADSKTVSF